MEIFLTILSDAVTAIGVTVNVVVGVVIILTLLRLFAYFVFNWNGL